MLTRAALAAAALATAALPLKTVATVPLPGGSSRLDYASVDPGRHRLYLAHLGGGLVIVFDTKRRRVVKTIPAPGAHGVLAVPSIGRVYASATDERKLLTIDSRTNRVIATAPAGDYPDGIAYDSKDRRVFVSDESGGREYVFTAGGHGIGSIGLGGEAGNVQYDPVTGHVLADVQTANVVAVINPRTLRVIRRVQLPGCNHDHGLDVDAPRRLAFVACDENARLLTLDLRTMKVTGNASVGGSPDVSRSTRDFAGCTSPPRRARSRSSRSAGGSSRSWARTSSRPRRTSSRSTRARTSCTSRCSRARRCGS